MAHVGISQALIEEVRQFVMRMKSSEYAARMREIKPAADRIFVRDMVPAEIDDMKALLWGEHLHLEAAIPDAWKVNRDDVKLRFGVDNDQYYFSVERNNNREIKFPPGTDTYGTMKVSRMPLVAAQYVQYESARRKLDKEVGEKYDGIYKQVSGYLKSCKSLNAALKALPEIKLYIPASYIERVEAKVERKAAQARAEEHAAIVDTTLITSTAVMHTFLGA